ncbi:hypothetical protein [Parafrankia sp. BMG5.11]|uniref:hypothetical protein n=1 Tax=Parafrankia sp. BMG5.11 TaxID=222540 RepID=UPI00103FFC4B|nr:hypothetical protein [Parafrankia sp. BMG5.11]TCJ32426.1 hypothetical protein E0504_42865 [Parafrankia sp. BMG5.11]
MGEELTRRQRILFWGALLALNVGIAVASFSVMAVLGVLTRPDSAPSAPAPVSVSVSVDHVDRMEVSR